MSDKLFDPAWIKWSNVQADFIPSGAVIISESDCMGIDEDYTVKGFFDQKTCEYHIQEVIRNTKRKLLAEKAVKPSKEHLHKPV